ncbi:MAG: hypothetical protein ACOC92_02030 [bacterium]
MTLGKPSANSPRASLRHGLPIATATLEEPERLEQFEILVRRAQARVVLGAVEWPGGPDLAPDAMYDAIREHGRWVVE